MTVRILRERGLLSGDSDYSGVCDDRATGIIGFVQRHEGELFLVFGGNFPLDRFGQPSFELQPMTIEGAQLALTRFVSKSICMIDKLYQSKVPRGNVRQIAEKLIGADPR